MRRCDIVWCQPERLLAIDGDRIDTSAHDLVQRRSVYRTEAVGGRCQTGALRDG